MVKYIMALQKRSVDKNLIILVELLGAGTRRTAVRDMSWIEGLS